MTLRTLRTPAALVFSTLLAVSLLAQTRPAAPDSPYGGTTVEEIVARVNDQIITRSDYERAMQEMDQEAKQHGASMQEISAGHRDLLRNLIDQQLWISKGKELGINGETELIQRLNEIRKQYKMDSLEDLEKSAKEQGVSFEDFKANIRNQIITQQVMRQEVGRKVQFTPGEAERYFNAHKQDFVKPESVHLSEILISTESAGAEDDAKLAAAQAKAADIEAKLHAGGDFTQLAKTFSEGTTASEGGEMGTYLRGQLNKTFEDQTFSLKTGEFTEPIRTKQGLVILKVDEHISGGVPAYKDVHDEVEERFYMSRMEPAIRDYLMQLREESYVDIKPGYTDTGASPKQIKPVYSAYAPPVAKKKKKVERTRFRETTRSYRQKSATAAADTPEKPASTAKASKKDVSLKAQKPGKKEKIRYGQAPTKTLPTGSETKTEDAGAGDAQTASAATEPSNPLEATKPVVKSRFSERAKLPKQPKAKGPQLDPSAPPAADTAEVADRQAQSTPLGLSGDTSVKKKKTKTTTADKTRLANKNKKPADTAPDNGAATVPPAADAPATTPAPQPEPAPAPQQ